MLGSVPGRTDFSQIFFWGVAGFFADFLAGFFLLIFVSKVPEKSSRKVLQNLYDRIPATHVCRGPGQELRIQYTYAYVKILSTIDFELDTHTQRSSLEFIL